MGACCSKTHTQPEVKIHQPEKSNNTTIEIFDSAEEQEAPKKDIFVVKHRKSHEIDKHPDQYIRKSIDRNKNPNSDDFQSAKTNSAGAGCLVTGELGTVVGGAAVRSSSCIEEDVDAILIQCGRLSRSSSGVNPAGGETPTRGRRFSGSKRSFDCDMEMDSRNDEPRVSSPLRRSSERDTQQQKFGNGKGGKRVSRSPNRRSESPNNNCSGGVAATLGGGSNLPGKMVSVPATDKSNSVGGGVEAVAAQEAACSRAATAPRSRSPVKANRRVLNQNQKTVTPTQSNSKKVEYSPYRRNPLGEIDTNIVDTEQPRNKKPIEKLMNNKANNAKNIIAKETQMLDQIVSRTRSSRLLRDIDINPESLINQNLNLNPPSNTTLILEDIQNFDHKKDNLVESDNIMEASFHKYVTVRRGGDADTEDKNHQGETALQVVNN